MIGPYFARNGRILPIEQAVIPIDNVNFAYGFGVYETMKIRRRVLFFDERHEKRLFESAEIIGLEHPFTAGEVVGAVRELAAANRVEDANVKVLLIGGSVSEGSAGAQCDVMLLNPLFPERKLYKRGAAAITVDAERQYPASKSLNMTVSTMAFRRAQRAEAYDALLVDRHGHVTEGTRTNLYAIRGESVVTPPLGQCLDGVTRETLLELLREQGIPVHEEPIHRAQLGLGEQRSNESEVAGVFVSSTSTKVLPLSRVDERDYEIPSLFRRIAQAYQEFLRDYAASQQTLW